MTITERLAKLEADKLTEGEAKDKLAEAQDDIVRLEERVQALYRFIEEQVGIRDPILERRLKETTAPAPMPERTL